MSAPSTSGLSVELLLRVIDVKYGCFTLLTLLYFKCKDYVYQHLSSISRILNIHFFQHLYCRDIQPSIHPYYYITRLSRGTAFEIFTSREY